MKQRISGYHRDHEQHWVAELACGHFQHVRHVPPWTNRAWVTTPQGRRRALGTLLNCRKCDTGAPPDRVPSSNAASGDAGAGSRGSER